MKTFKQLMESLKNDPRIHDEGLYSSVKPTTESRDELDKFLDKCFGIKCRDDVHATVMYSTKSIDTNLAKQYSKNVYSAYPKEFQYWDGHDNSGYLVLKIDSDDLSQEHDRLVSHGCKPTFSPYSAHITIIHPIDKEDGVKKANIGNNELGNLLKRIELKFNNQKLDTLKQ